MATHPPGAAMSRHHLMIAYWRDTSQPQGSQTLTVAGDDPREVLALSNARALAWMGSEAVEPQDDEDEPEGQSEGEPSLWG